jgi:hypothetical protein
MTSVTAANEEKNSSSKAANTGCKLVAKTGKVD